MKPPPADPTQPPLFTVDHEGKLDGYYTYHRAHDDRRTWTTNEHARLELAGRKIRAPLEPQLPARSKLPRRRMIVALAILGAACVLPWGARWGYQLWSDYKARSANPAGLVFIDSAPFNARVFIDGQEVGRTPYVAPNTFTRGTVVPVRLVYPGAQDWFGTFPGGTNASFTADLQAQ